MWGTSGLVFVMAEGILIAAVRPISEESRFSDSWVTMIWSL